MKNIKLLLRQNKVLWSVTRLVYLWLLPIYSHPLTCWVGYFRLFVTWREYLSAGGRASLRDFHPCLSDRTSETSFDPQYFYQAAWAMSAISQSRPVQHADVGSDVKFVGMLSAITKVVFVDIRPLQVSLPNLECRSGTITDLPFADNSLESLSSLHVIEHVGLGRYGDPVDPYGSEKACAELKRVLACGGVLYVSFPLGTPRVQFNGHRIFAPTEVATLFEGLTLIQSALIDNHGRFLAEFDLNAVEFDEELGQEFSLGCFAFQKLGA